MSKARKVVLAFCPLLLPIFCTVVIHHYFHLVFGQNNLTLGIYSRDIYIPLGIGAVFSLYKMIGSGVSLRIRHRWLFLTSILLVSLVLILKNYFFLSAYFSQPFLVVLLLSGCVLLLVLSFISTIKFSEVLAYIRKENTAAAYVLICLVSLFNYPLILKYFWREASYLTAKAIYWVYKICGVPLGIRLTPVSFNLSGGGFAIKIIMGCSGLEGIFFFIFAFSLIQCLEKRGFSWTVLTAYGVGSIFLFLLNTFRISIFYLLGIQMERMSLGGMGKRLIEGAFHNHIGWILYLAGIIFFVRTYRRFEKVKWAVRESNP